ncbi:hypothetical protein [Mesorhizobium sp. M6A.T.Ce.TU.016.01.1.1]|uniref:hypothetical protein n=1 Tax=Mesorhizobium sp. M6A.T.Ce.TU.016.01.1.1 TaxID=2496783 RepID=UPI000FCC35B2|nr:hypothetical protein [Mesorhizobium sp. M6A.T.Ce.TU.016.01.1.1]RUU29759.1 hypothetical protein EOC94_12900 [Mesorhizobium sp. M6A.T.Ce.TU.016.01.1.1]
MSVRVAEIGNLYGREIIKGTDDEIPAELFGDLEAAGYVAERGGKTMKVALRDDGPTIAEYVAAGYPASNYPPEGYASRSTPEEIADAVKAAKADEKAAKAAAKKRDAILADLAGLSDEDLAKVVDAEKIAVVDGDSKEVVVGKIADARMAAQG